jgi:hypothetical protein
MLRCCVGKSVSSTIMKTVHFDGMGRGAEMAIRAGTGEASWGGHGILGRMFQAFFL